MLRLGSLGLFAAESGFEVLRGLHCQSFKFDQLFRHHDEARGSWGAPLSPRPCQGPQHPGDDGDGDDGDVGDDDDGDDGGEAYGEQYC